MIEWSTQRYRQDLQTRDKQCSICVQSAGNNADNNLASRLLGMGVGSFFVIFLAFTWNFEVKF